MALREEPQAIVLNVACAKNQKEDGGSAQNACLKRIEMLLGP